MAACPVLPPLALKRRRHHLTISRLNSVASLPAVYASRRTLPCAMQHALPAGWLAFTGRGFHPLDRDVGFQFRLTSLHPPIQSLAWRKALLYLTLLEMLPIEQKRTLLTFFARSIVTNSLAENLAGTRWSP